jgi:hypothetical protein
LVAPSFGTAGKLASQLVFILLVTFEGDRAQGRFIKFHCVGAIPDLKKGKMVVCILQPAGFFISISQMYDIG